jgi:Holliday junction resolvase RusA-like endonuclease
VITFFIKGDPRGKGRPRATAVGGRARVYTDAKTKAYEAAIAAAARQAMGNMPPLTGPVHVEIMAFMEPVKSASKRVRAAMLAGDSWPTKKPDLDNIQKAVLDGLNKIAFVDDAQVCSMFCVKYYAEKSCIRISVQGLGDD